MFVPIGPNPISTRLLGRDECFAEGERDGDDNGYEMAREPVCIASPLASVSEEEWGLIISPIRGATIHVCL